MEEKRQTDRQSIGRSDGGLACASREWNNFLQADARASGIDGMTVIVAVYPRGKENLAYRSACCRPLSPACFPFRDCEISSNINFAIKTVVRLSYLSFRRVDFADGWRRERESRGRYRKNEKTKKNKLKVGHYRWNDEMLYRAALFN